MSIQNDAGTEGTGAVNPMAVQVALGAITMDMNIGQGTTTGDLIQVTYVGAPGNATATRISQLCNTNFNVSAGRPDIILLGVGPSFTTLDGRTNCGNGFTAPPGNVDNPTTSVLVVFDTSNGNGGGIFVRPPGGSVGTNTSPSPNSCVLYHELSHALRVANGTWGAPGTGSPPGTDDELAAIADENVLRPLLGLALRDPNPPHDATSPSCGGPPGSTGGCCVVASIATGSIYSEEVNALRAIRDRVLRRSDIGYDFFDRLHYDYYAFSPEVCRQMARSAELQERVRLYFVGPLARVLKLAHRRIAEELDDAALGAAFEEGVLGSEMAGLARKQLEEALSLLGVVRRPEVALPPRLAQFADYLDGVARSSPFIGWALLDPVEIYTRMLRWRLERLEQAELGRRLGRSLDEWAARMPLTDVWTKLSPLGLARELDFLGNTLVREPSARAELGRRLLTLPGADADESRLAALRAAGFSPVEEAHS